MNELITVLEVAILFLMRVGFPIIVMVCLGFFIDHWQSKARQ